MQIAVTGATGFIGRYVLDHLIANGHTARAWHRTTSDRTGLEHLADKLTWIEGDLGDDKAAKSLVKGCDAVVHAALHYAYKPYGDAEWNVIDFAEKNIVGTLRLIEAARAAGAQRFVFISSGAVHEKILDDRPLDETHPTWPLTEYGAYKAAIENFVHSYGFGEGYPICSLRPTHVYGVAYPAKRRTWYDLVRSVVRGETVSATRGSKEVHVLDVAKAVGILLNAGASQITGEAFDCCDRYISEHEVATLAKSISGSNAVIEGEPSQPKHQIVTKKIQSLGMQFGGQQLFEKTVRQLVEEANREN